MEYYPNPSGTVGGRGAKSKPAKYVGPKPSRRRIKPFKPGNKGRVGAAVPRPAKYIGPEPRRTRPTAGGTPKSKKMVPAVKRKRNPGYNK